MLLDFFRLQSRTYMQRSNAGYTRTAIRAICCRRGRMLVRVRPRNGQRNEQPKF